MEIWTYLIYINHVQLFVTFQRKSTKTQFWSDVTKISWTQKPCSNIKGQCLPVSEKENFEVGLLCSYVPSCDPRGGASFDPRGIK